MSSVFSGRQERVEGTHRKKTKQNNNGTKFYVKILRHLASTEHRKVETTQWKIGAQDSEHCFSCTLHG
jgi:hypothetical protein